MTDLSRTRSAIENSGRVKYKDTRDERAFVALFEGLGLRVTTPPPVKVWSRDKSGEGPMKLYTLEPDHEIWVPRLHRLDLGVYGYTDGILHRTPTQRRKDAWESELIYKFTGTRVFRTDSDYLLDERWWPDVASRFAGFMMKDTPPWWRFER